MTPASRTTAPRWRIAVTRHAPLPARIDAIDAVVTSCPVLEEAPPEDDAPLRTAATQLASFDWVICASARSVAALARACRARGDQPWWPRGVRAATVGAVTARALSAAGAQDPVVGRESGAVSLWQTLADIGAGAQEHERHRALDEGASREPGPGAPSLRSWDGVRVLLLTTPGGLDVLRPNLLAAGADLTVVDAYVMRPRSISGIQADWRAIDPNALVVTSPRSARTLAGAVGTDALSALDVVVAIGDTTRRAIEAWPVRHAVAAEADLSALGGWWPAAVASRDTVA